MAPTVSLRVHELTKTFGGLTALKEVSFAVEEGSITGLIGPNGSGKTVAFDCITGFYKPDQGRAFFRNQDIFEQDARGAVNRAKRSGQAMGGRVGRGFEFLVRGFVLGKRLMGQVNGPLHPHEGGDNVLIR